MTIDESEREEEPRIVVTGTEGGAHEIKIVGPKVFADRIGPDLFAAFLKCFVGCDRISTFEQMLLFNVGFAPVVRAVA
jgi:hypothetical protein